MTCPRCEDKGIVAASRTEVGGYVDWQPCECRRSNYNPSREPRPSWDEYFLQVAEVAAKRASCPRASVGAIMVQENHIISTGYNGALSNHDDCLTVGCDIVSIDGVPHCSRIIHAEMNAIIQAAIHGAETWGSTLYITHYPCWVCTKHLIAAGVARVVYRNVYKPDERVVNAFAKVGIPLVKV